MQDEQGALPSGTDDPSVRMPSWERRDEIGLIPALVRTVWETLFFPGRVFRSPHPTDGTHAAFLYAVVFGTICLIGPVAIAGPSLAVSHLTSGGLYPKPFNPNVNHFVFYFGAVLSVPVLCGIWSYISAAIMHACLVVPFFGKSRLRFDVTYRINAYLYTCLLLSVTVAFLLSFIMFALDEHGAMALTALVERHAISSVLLLSVRGDLDVGFTIFVFPLGLIGLFWFALLGTEALVRAHAIGFRQARGALLRLTCVYLLFGYVLFALSHLYIHD